MDKPSELQKLQFDYAWKWFSFHADQRTKVFNFMFLVAGVLATAFATAYDKSHFIAALLSLAGALAMVMFLFLDYRNRVLLRYGEEVLTHLEREAIFGENSKINSRDGTPITFGILFYQHKKDEAHSGNKWWRDARLCRHRFWNPVFAGVFSIAFLTLFFFVLFSSC